MSWRTVSFSTLLHGVGVISTRLLALPEGLHVVGFSFRGLLAFPEEFHGTGFSFKGILAYPEKFRGVGVSFTRLLPYPEGFRGAGFIFCTTCSFSRRIPWSRCQIYTTFIFFRTLLHLISVIQDRNCNGLWWLYVIVVLIGVLDFFHCLRWEETFWRLDLPLSVGVVLGLSAGPTKIGYSVFPSPSDHGAHSAFEMQ
jgi:hypothetical protein